MTYIPAPNIETTLLGLRITDIRHDKGRRDDIVRIYTWDDKLKERVFELYHDQDCCECVRVIDIRGDLDQLYVYPTSEVKEQIIRWEGKGTKDWPADVSSSDDSSTLTVFTFTVNPYGHPTSVVVRWLGTSNGYYSESVSFREVTKK